MCAILFSKYVISFEFKRILQKNFIVMFNTGDNKTRICGIERNHCIQQAQSKLFGGYIDAKEFEKAQPFRINCDCLATCNSIEYELFADRTGDNSRMSKLTNTKCAHFSNYCTFEFLTQF